MPRQELRWPGRTATAVTTAGAPSAPSNLTSITKDAGATLSFTAPVSSGSGGPVTSYTATPYIAGVAQAPATTAVGSAGSITGSNGNTYVQIPAGTLTNGTAYTFSVHASNAAGASPESGQSGANTPLSGLVFGDDFNGPASGPVDPEWWVYDNRCGYLAQSEVEAYAAANCVLDGSGNLQLTAQHVSKTVPRYPSDPLYPGNITQPWTSGACQSNTRTYNPAAGNTMTFEARQQLCADAGNGFFPGLFWLEGSTYLTAWKTDPLQAGHDSTGKAEIDVAEWPPGQASATQYTQSSWTSSSQYTASVTPGFDTSAAMHVYSVQWKPGVSVKFFLDGTLTNTASSNIPADGSNFFLLLYLQMLAGGPTTTESCLIDRVRVYDQNLG